MFQKFTLAACMVLLFSASAYAQVRTNRTILERIAREHRDIQQKRLKEAVTLAKEKGWPLSFKTAAGNNAYLVEVDLFGLPRYVATENNVIAAATTGANKLWSGGSSGLNLTGSSGFLKGKMAVWDGGSVLSNHVELTGRVQQKDFPSAVSDHSTHVAGTMIASGVNPLARGMAYGYQNLLAYDFFNDVAEMSNEASGLLLSNHSYGTITGWYYNSSSSRWEFRGRFGENEDYHFGYYDFDAQLWDSIAYNAPYYLIVKSAGNNRSQNGPAEGQTYYRFDLSGQMINAGPRPAGISNNDGYDIIATYGTAKNVLTVGAVNGITNGYFKVADVGMSSFSSWGPTDDGRIKPDVVADGVNVLSSTNATTSSYASFSGTSMASPNTTGSLLLLQEYYAQLHKDSFMRAATLKAIAIHTADQADDVPGPNYKFGWGLLNVAKGAEVIRSRNNGTHRIYENVLNNGQTYTTTVVASGRGPLVATIVWTDPKGNVETTNILNNPSLKLVNDLDIRIKQGSDTYKPWILNPALPYAAATTGDNIRDNVERIDINNPVPGRTYIIEITHKNTLQRASQAYSLILSGVGGQAYCTSAPAASSGARIDSIALGSLRRSNPAGCTSYTDNTQFVVTVEPNQNLPVFLNIGNCDGSARPRVAKIFIDYNSNGSFSDAGELAATSPVINGAGSFSSSIAIPQNVVPGNSAIIRIVMQETGNAADVTGCGSYGNGETQDYMIRFVSPSSDLATLEVSTPSAATCATPAQLLAVKIRNNGTTSKSNIPVTVQVKSGTTTVASFTSFYPGTIGASEIVNYTLQNSFNAVAGHYSITAYVSEATDQQRTNDTLYSNLFIGQTPSGPPGAAEICGSSAILKTTAMGNNFWYDNAGADAPPIAAGNYQNTAIVPPNKTYYLSQGMKGTAGLASKSAYPGGGGYLTSNAANFMRYLSTVPLVLETARLYSKYGGKVEFMVADIVSQNATSYSYSVISSTIIDIYATSPNPAPGAQTGYDAADEGAIFSLNLDLPAGDHAIIVRPIGDANLFRNNNVTGSPYPFSVPGVISFYNNSATSATDPNNYQNFYYYLYNMRFRTTDCMSTKTAVVANVAPVPAITMVNDSLVSSIDEGNQWFLNGVVIAGATTKKYKPTQPGNYTVSVSDSFFCQQTSSVYTHSITAVNPVANAEVHLKIAPNPSKGNFVLSFNMVKREDLRIDLVNAQGQTVLIKQYPKFQGKFSEEFQLQSFASGVYMMRIAHGGKNWYNKVVIQK